MRILILGGGISGLSAAWYLRKRYSGAKITLLERENRLGGWIQTVDSFEKGPRTFPFSRCPSLLELIEDLGLKDEIVSSDPAASKRYLWIGGRLRTLGSLLPALIPSLVREPFIRRKKEGDESIRDFAVRRFGRRAAETLFDPMALGIFAGDIRSLSLSSCFPALREWEQKYGSVIRALLVQKKRKAPCGLFTLKRGMGSLIEALQKKIPAEILVSSPVEAIEKDGVVSNGRFIGADRIVSALPGPAIGRLTGSWTDFSAATIWVVNCAYPGNVLPKKGYGYLVPTMEREPLLGMIWDSSLFPNPAGETRITAMLRPYGDAAWAKRVACDCLKRHLRIERLPSRIEPFLASEAIPQFEVGFAERLSRFKAELKHPFPNLALIGNYLEGASVDACVKAAKNLDFG